MFSTMDTLLTVLQNKNLSVGGPIQLSNFKLTLDLTQTLIVSQGTFLNLREHTIATLIAQLGNASTMTDAVSFLLLAYSDANNNNDIPSNWHQPYDVNTAAYFLSASPSAIQLQMINTI